jgi:SAM-dependent methyltransferase
MKELKNHYKKLFSEYGNSANAVQYTDTKSQLKRFEVLSEIDVQLNTVIDLGCGLGHLYDYLEIKEPGIEYLGLDFVEEFIEIAKNKSSVENVNFKLYDIENDTIPKGYDYVLLSGVFNNIMVNNWEFMKLTLRKMFAACNKGIAFNAMSTYVDYFDESLFYVDPCKVFDFCKKELGAKVTLRNDYLIKEKSIPFEFAVYVYK